MIDAFDFREVSTDVLAIWLEEIAQNLRPSDLDEIAATSEAPPLASLVASVLASDMAWMVVLDGSPVAIFGVAPTPLREAGSVWMMGTPDIDRAPLAILRGCRRYLDLMHRRYPLLWNYIDARNEKSMRWLRWLGFRLLEAHPQHGREERLFFTFARYEPHV